MSEFKLTTPVTFIIFNRPDTTERVFAEIAKTKPPKLLVVGDGARLNCVGEQEKVLATREIIKRVDWDCEVITNYSDVNLGCKQRVSSGLDWVFSQVEETIILEDDCMPDPTFFRFCQELLEYYRDDLRVGMISGDNFQISNSQEDFSYYFSKYTHIWGWATWSNRWLKNYDVNIERWPIIRDQKYLSHIMDDKEEALYWHNIFESVFNGEIDTWDYQWVLTNISEGRLNIMPNVNLISNIGFGENATHTKHHNIYANMEVGEIEFPLKHPLFMLRNKIADMHTKKSMFHRPMWKRIASKIRNHLVK